MTQEEIIEGNKVISEFLGAKFVYYTLDRKDQTKELAFIDQTSSPPLNHMWRCSLTPENNFSWSYPHDLRYHNDWNKLMRVIEKIEAISIPIKKYNTIEWFEIHMHLNKVQINSGLNHPNIVSPYSYHDYNWESETKIEATWKCVVKFIKWYSLRQKENTD